MKLRILIVAVVTLLAGSLFAAEVDSVLTSDSTFWTVSVPAESAHLELTRRNGELRSAIVVPTTDDDAIESDARLAWDRRSNTLFVMWERAAEGVNETKLAALLDDGTWSEPMVIAADGARRAGLQLVMTSIHEEDADTTFLHAAWWKLSGEDVEVEYALLAFDGGTLLSTDVSTLNATEHSTFAVEDTGAPVHPPLAMVRDKDGVEVIFGERDTTAVNRVNLQPNRIEANARMWRPGRSVAGTRTPSSRLASNDGKPVQSFAVNGRIVLYTPDAMSRYSIFDNGEWTPVRMIKLDENLTSEHLLQELHRAVETNAPLETTPDSE
jgi:hypothetical protein